MGAQRLGDEFHYPLVTTVLGRPWARCNTHKPPFQGYNIIPLLPCSLLILGKARGVNPNKKSRAGVPKKVVQDYATPAAPVTLLAPKQYQRLSFPWIHQPCGEGLLAAWTIARLLYTLPRLCSFTRDCAQALLRSLM